MAVPYTNRRRQDAQVPNRLAAATSPYLQQHRDNPVDWYEWGPEAFAEARRRDVPVLLSVGYAACHWCQVTYEPRLPCLKQESGRSEHDRRIGSGLSVPRFPSVAANSYVNLVCQIHRHHGSAVMAHRDRKSRASAAAGTSKQGLCRCGGDGRVLLER